MDIWIPASDVIDLLGITKQSLHKARRERKYHSRIITGKGGDQYEFSLLTLPMQARMAYWEKQKATEPVIKASESEIYAAAPEHAKRKADKYLTLIKQAHGLKGSDLRTFIAYWNRNHPGDKTSYVRLLDARVKFARDGIVALLGKYGKRSGVSSVPDDLFTFFKSLYLVEQRPSAESCWKIALGFAQEHGCDTAKMPMPNAFVRRLKKEVPEAAIYAARFGAHAANGRYGFYLKRNMDDVLSGECWVFDHAQIDIAVFYKDENGREKVAFPWITVARDYKSGKWVGWDLYIGGPNSDNIFMAFFRAAIKWGIPIYLYLDNGKDFRCNNFSGGRTQHRLQVDEAKTTAMTAALGISTVFAWPYNAQAKPVERDFLRLKEWFSRLSPGYRGGNVVERPDCLNDNIDSRKIMTFAELEKLLPVFIEDVVMKTPVTSGYREGKSPDEIWQTEYPEALRRGLARIHTREALMLFCTRTTPAHNIGRRGFHDSQLGVDYYNAWMEGQKGRKVYLRRDQRAMQDAWVFDSSTHEYLGQAYYLPETPGLARTDISKQQLAADIAVKRNAEKVLRALSKPDNEIPFDYKIACMASATKALNDKRGFVEQPAPEPGQIHVTGMDLVAAKRRRLDEEGTVDISELSKLADAGEPAERVLYIWESERDEAKVANG